MRGVRGRGERGEGRVERGDVRGERGRRMVQGRGGGAGKGSEG